MGGCDLSECRDPHVSWFIEGRGASSLMRWVGVYYIVTEFRNGRGQSVLRSAAKDSG